MAAALEGERHPYRLMNLADLLYRLFPRMRARARAREAASEACRLLLPDEPILGSAICAEEPGFYVVRVFCGDRPLSPDLAKLPPWKLCVIFAVSKDTFSAERIIEDEKYRPTIR